MGLHWNKVTKKNVAPMMLTNIRRPIIIFLKPTWGKTLNLKRGVSLPKKNCEGMYLHRKIELSF